MIKEKVSISNIRTGVIFKNDDMNKAHVLIIKDLKNKYRMLNAFTFTMIEEDINDIYQIKNWLIDNNYTVLKIIKL